MNTTYILIGLALIVIVLLIVLMVKISNSKSNIDSSATGEIKDELYKILTDNSSRQEKNLREAILSLQDNTQKSITSGFSNISESTLKNSKILVDTLNEGMERISKTTDKKLSEIQGNVNEKLDKSLNERLDENFKQVGERLESLYKSLGEIRNLENGVVSLNKTLSNVKTRGVFGEMQLDNILANILDSSQYDKQIPVTKRGTEPVDFAIKIPDKEDKGGFIYLPIDSKFPSDIYNKIVEASLGTDTSALEDAQKELKTRIESEAKSINDKYVKPPFTTDFAIMFLPTESLYSEVLRIPGLAEKCQEKYKIVISGPMSITALLNSLSIGFKYLTVNKKTNEIRKTLVQFKKDFEKFDELIEKTQSAIDQAKKKSMDLSQRNGYIKERLSKVEKYEIEENESITHAIEESLDINEN